MTPVGGAHPVVASVLWLQLRGLAEDSAPRQAQRRGQLAQALRDALAGWPAAHRVVLEAPEGLAVAGEVEAGLALDAAVRMLELAPDAGLAIALHRGAVRAQAAADAKDGARLAGDGLETAAAMAALPQAGPVVLSQAFRDALLLRRPRLAGELQPAGELVDAGLRSHVLHTFDPAASRLRRLRRSLFGVAGLLLLLGAGLGGRVARERYVAARRPAVIHLDIQPTGEVWLDGVRKGTAPPLAKLWVPPGPHVIEVRNGRNKPLRVTLQLQPAEQVQVRHLFAPPPRPPARRQPRFFDRFKFW